MDKLLSLVYAITCSFLVICLISGRESVLGHFSVKAEKEDKLAAVLKSAFDQCSDPAMITEGSVFFCINPQAVEFLKVSSAQGKDIKEYESQFKEFVLDPSIDKANTHRCSNFFEVLELSASSTEVSNDIFSSVIQRGEKEKEEKKVEIHVSKVISGGRKYYLFTFIDLSFIRQSERKRASLESKAFLLSSLSHELHTPLNGIIGILKPFLNHPESIPKKSLQMAFMSAQVLSNYISNVLDYAKNKGGHLETKRQAVNVKKLAEKVLYMFEDQVKLVRVKLAYSADSDVPSGMMTDKKKIKQVLMNLLGISLRYTHKGFVTLRLSMWENRFAVEIADTGSGLPFSLDKCDVFSVKADRTDQTFCDSGIHLAATWSIVEKLGGKMVIKSSVNHGTFIRIEFAMNYLSGDIRRFSQYPTVPIGKASPSERKTMCVLMSQQPALKPSLRQSEDPVSDDESQIIEKDHIRTQKVYPSLQDGRHSLFTLKPVIVEAHKPETAFKLEEASPEIKKDNTTKEEEKIPTILVEEVKEINFEKMNSIEGEKDKKALLGSYREERRSRKKDEEPSELHIEFQEKIDFKFDEEKAGKRIDDKPKQEIIINPLSSEDRLISRCECKKILIVDDSAINIFALKGQLNRIGLECTEVSLIIIYKR